MLSLKCLNTILADINLPLNYCEILCSWIASKIIEIFIMYNQLVTIHILFTKLKKILFPFKNINFSKFFNLLFWSNFMNQIITVNKNIIITITNKFLTT